MSFETAYDFVKKNATIDEDGNATLTQKQYETYLSDNGITKQIQQSFTDANRDFYSASYKLTADLLTEKVKKAEGDDKKKQQASFAVNIPDGKLTFSQDAYREFHSPQDPAKVIPGVVYTRINIKQTRKINRDVIAECEADMKKLLGIKD